MYQGHFNNVWAVCSVIRTNFRHLCFHNLQRLPRTLPGNRTCPAIILAMTSTFVFTYKNKLGISVIHSTAMNPGSQRSIIGPCIYVQ